MVYVTIENIKVHTSDIVDKVYVLVYSGILTSEVKFSSCISFVIVERKGCSNFPVKHRFFLQNRSCKLYISKYF